MLLKFILVWLQLFVLALILTQINSFQQKLNSYEFFANGYYNPKKFIIRANLSITLFQCANLCIDQPNCEGFFYLQNQSIVGTVNSCTYLIEHLYSDNLMTMDLNFKYYRQSPVVFDALNSCLDITDRGLPIGLYNIKLDNFQYIRVLCYAGGSMRVQINNFLQPMFNRTWELYKQGFGDVRRSFWIGNEVLHHLTNQSNYRVFFYARKSNESFNRYISYDNFFVDSEENQYKMSFGNIVVGNDSVDISSVHNGMPFSTYDRDNDNSAENCAAKHGGGFWFNNCMVYNPNGVKRADYETEQDDAIMFLLINGKKPLLNTQMAIRLMS